MDFAMLPLRPQYSPIDFKVLAEKDENFKQIWEKSLGKLNFHDAQTVQTLSKAILMADFGLKLEVPGDRLCPPIPNRWNYVAFIHSLIDSTSSNYANTYEPDREVKGLDIGTGASAIYTMLCLKSRPNWTMCATDIDKKSFESAARNLALNNLMTRTILFQATESNPLISLQALGVDHLDFVMCNPPFFTDTEEMNSSLEGAGKSSAPNAICTGAEVEMVCEGGDLGFVTRMLNESLVLRERVQWYTSMLCKLSSAKAIIELLKHHAINNWAVGCIETGSKTKRWVVAWSFHDLRPSTNVARHAHIAGECLPFPTTYTIQLPSAYSTEVAASLINATLSSLDLAWHWNSESSTGMASASQNVWSRAYRRAFAKKKKEAEQKDLTEADGMRDDNEDAVVAIVCRVRVIDLENRTKVDLDWLRGMDQVLFESFCGMVHGLFREKK